MTGLVKKAGLGAVMAATVLSVAAPAEAQRYYRHRDRGGDAAAAAIIGGVIGLGVGAAIASNNRPRYYYDDGYYGPRYRPVPRRFYRNYYGPPPRAYYRGYNRGYYNRGYYGGW